MLNSNVLQLGNATLGAGCSSLAAQHALWLIHGIIALSGVTQSPLSLSAVGAARLRNRRRHLPTTRHRAKSGPQRRARPIPPGDGWAGGAAPDRSRDCGLLGEQGSSEASQQGSRTRIHHHASGLPQRVLREAAAQHADSCDLGLLRGFGIVGRVADRDGIPALDLEPAKGDLEDVGCSIRTVAGLTQAGLCHFTP